MDLNKGVIAPLLIVDSHVDIINRDLLELKKLLKEYDDTNYLETQKNYWKN